MVTASKRWALVVGLVLIVLGLAGGTAWLGHPWDRATAPGAPVGFAGAPAIGGTDKPGTSPTGAAPASNSSRPTSNSSRPAPGAVSARLVGCADLAAAGRLHHGGAPAGATLRYRPRRAVGRHRGGRTGRTQR